MLTLDKLLTKWKLWINRDHTFQADELKELQSHLMEEINFLVNREGLSEEEAFHKAVRLVGEREGLDQEYKKINKKPFHGLNIWTQNHVWQLLICLLLILVFSTSDLIFALNHYRETPQTIGLDSVGFKKVPKTHSEMRYYFAPGKKSKKTFLMKVKSFFNLDMITVAEENGFTVKAHASDMMEPDLSWEDISFQCQTIPKSWMFQNLDGTYYYLVRDNNDVIWFSYTKFFTIKSPHIHLKPISQKEIVKNYMDMTTFVPDIHVDNKDNPNLIMLNDGKKTILLQIVGFEMTTTLEKKPYESLYDNIVDESILWKEIKVIRKPVHLLPFLYNQMKDSIVKNNQVQKKKKPLEGIDAIS
jgi:hypothetical protein